MNPSLYINQGFPYVGVFGGMTKSKIEGCIFGKRGAQLFDFFLKSGPQSVEEQGVNERKGRTRFLGGGREW